MGMRRARIARSIPTITDSFVLSFAFFICSDIHQSLREPTVENLVKVLTSLQFTANSPFDYPAFFFMSLVILNLLAAVLARLHQKEDLRLVVRCIPIRHFDQTPDEAQRDCLQLARALRRRAEEVGVRGQVSMRSIRETAERRALRAAELEELRGAISEVIVDIRPIDVDVHRSPLTSLLLYVSSKVGLPVGGIYHPLQRKMSLNPELNVLMYAYVYVHEVFHSLGLGEVPAEIGTIQVCMRMGCYNGIPMDLLGIYLLFRASAAYLDHIHAIQGLEEELSGLRYGWQGFGSLLLGARKGRMERDIYLWLKTKHGLIRDSPPVL